jgi:hypothetical protein
MIANCLAGIWKNILKAGKLFDETKNWKVEDIVIGSEETGYNDLMAFKLIVRSAIFCKHNGHKYGSVTLLNAAIRFIIGF